LADLKNQTQQLETELSQKVSKVTELEAELRDAVEADAEKTASESRQLEQQELKLNELQTALAEEKELRAEVSQKLEASENRISELEKETGDSTVDQAVDQANYEELEQKVEKYKTALRKSKSVVEKLSAQKSEMSQLATEYLSAAKVLRRDLDHQLEASQKLKSKLAQSGAGNSDSPSQDDLNRLVEKRARAYVLKLKSQFEERLKEKNDLIRKLQSRNTVES